MIVYVDVLIVLNTLVNYFILLGVRKITRAYCSRVRIATGALISGFSALLILLDDLGLIMTLLKVASAVLTVVVTFGCRSVRQLLKSIFFFFAITFVFGGLALAVYMLSEKSILIYTNGIIYFDVDMTFLVVCCVISYGVITLITKFTDKKVSESLEYTVTIQNKGVSVTAKALMDTGNSLREPFSAYPVVIVDKALFDKLFTEEKIRLIPVSTVNNETLIRAFRPERLIFGEFITDKVYIGESLTDLDEYKIILNEGVFDNEQNYNTHKKTLHKTV